MNLVLGCVAENTPKYFSQALRLVQSVRWFGGALSKAIMYVCMVDEIRGEYREELEQYDIEIRTVPRFNAEHPQSNKLRFLELPELAKHERVLLLDCDTLVVRDPSYALSRAEFAAKIADVPTVPLDIFRRLFDAFSLSIPQADQHCTVRGERTIPYFNAGVLVFARRAMDVLVPKWIALNAQLIDRIDLLEEHRNFCEQASLSLALAATKTRFEALGNEFNFPTHFSDPAAAPNLIDVDPFIIHYHSLVDPSGHVLPSSYALVNRRIEMFNVRLRHERESRFNNRLFWNHRYVEDPELGSGVGSRGVAQEHKRHLLTEVVDRFQPKDILDVGCGDMQVSSVLPANSYTGIDFSEEIVSVNRKKFPERTFLAGDFLKFETMSADMVVCLDVLIHLASRDDYRSFVRKLVSSTRRVGIVAGDEAEPGVGSIVFFHESLSRTLADAGATNICKIGGYRHLTVFRFEPPRKQNALVVLGMHRSGTSALGGVLSLLGLHVGRSLIPAVDGVNPKGFWEHAGVVDVHERLLGKLGSSWHDERDLPKEWWTRPGVEQFRQELRNILQADFSDVENWMVKDPRLCRLLPLWQPIFETGWCRPYVIMIVRDPREVAQSLARRDGISEERAHLLWLQHVFDSEKWTRNYPRVLITFEDLLKDWRATFDYVCSTLSLSLNYADSDVQHRVEEFLEPSLRHHSTAAPPLSQSSRLALETYQTCAQTRDLTRLGSVLAPLAGRATELADLFCGWSAEIQFLWCSRQETTESLSKEVARVKSTVSWRITAPLRAMWRFYKRYINRA